jgi:hypothetical protein
MIKAHVQAETWFSAADAVKQGYATTVAPAVKMSALWKPSDHPALPASAKALATTTPGMQAATARLEAIQAQAKADAAKAAAKPASTTPHLDKFASLTGGEATRYYREHTREIRAEQLAANHTGPDKLTIDPKTGIVITSHK